MGPTWGGFVVRVVRVPHPQENKRKRKEEEDEDRTPQPKSKPGKPRPQGDTGGVPVCLPPDRRIPTDQPQPSPSTQRHKPEAVTDSRGMRSYDLGEAGTSGETDTPGARTVQATILTVGFAPAWCSPGEPSAQAWACGGKERRRRRRRRTHRRAHTTQRIPSPGAHTRTHTRLNDCDLRQRQRERPTPI